MPIFKDLFLVSGWDYLYLLVKFIQLDRDTELLVVLLFLISWISVADSGKNTEHGAIIQRLIFNFRMLVSNWQHNYTTPG